MRERLIELFSEFEITGCDNCDGLEKSCRECSLGRIADYLLANGVIVPPCKVGDTVWFDTYKKNATVQRETMKTI